ncbi:MAG: hypothetical protein GWP56_00025 [Gammaproteobacteria bacterium]|jgi:hypothetical protein|nr:hypothetical protein [Gammaproteobacteria bacterium]
MKRLILVFFVTCQMIISSAALAWSPLDGVEEAIDSMQNCLFTTASSEQSQEAGEKEQEEEPDCE